MPLIWCLPEESVPVPPDGPSWLQMLLLLSWAVKMYWLTCRVTHSWLMWCSCSGVGMCRSGTKSGTCSSTRLTWSASHQSPVISCHMTSSSSFTSLFLPTFSSALSSLSVSRIFAAWPAIPLSQTTSLAFTCHWCGHRRCACQRRLCWHSLWITFFHWPAAITIPLSLCPVCKLFLLSQLPWSHSVFTFCFRARKVVHTCFCSSTCSWLRCK